MKQYLITKIITAQLVVDCADEFEARKWEDRIVASLEDETGNSIPPQNELEFTASCSPSESSFEIVEESAS
jgi:hypothetical protein